MSKLDMPRRAGFQPAEHCQLPVDVRNAQPLPAARLPRRRNRARPRQDGCMPPFSNFHTIQLKATLIEYRRTYLKEDPHTRDSPPANICFSAQDFSQQGLSNMLWALAVLRHAPGAPFLDAAAGQILECLHDFNAQVQPCIVFFSTASHALLRSWRAACQLVACLL